MPLPRLLFVFCSAVALTFAPLPRTAAGADVAGPYLAARSADRTGDYLSAAQYYTQALIADPANTGIMEGLVLAQIASGAVGQAVPVARRLVSSGNRSQSALLTLLTEQFREGAFAQAAADLEGGRMIGPLVDGLVHGWAELGMGRMTPALEAFDALATTSGLEYFGNYNKAMALAMVGDFESADALFADEGLGLRFTRRGTLAHVQVLSQLDRNQDALDLLATGFGGTGDPEIDSARASLLSGQQLPFTAVKQPSDGVAETYLMIAGALANEAPAQQTLLYARFAQYLRPDLADAALLAAVTLERLEQFDLAVTAYETVAADNLAWLSARTGRAQALYAIDRNEEAIGELEALTMAHPDRFSLQLALGDLLRREERFTEAAEAYSRGIALVDEPEQRHWSMFYTRGIAYERAKVWEKAEPDFRRALELFPDQPQVLNYLGYSLLELGRDFDEALDMIKRAVEQRPDDGYIIDSLAWGYFLLGRFDEALEPMERASLLMPLDPIVTDHLGDVYWAVGRKLEARFQWRRALSFDPEEKDAERIRRKLDIGLDAMLAEEEAVPLAERGQ